MFITINTSNRRISIEGTDNEKKDPYLMKKIGIMLRMISDKINPPEVPELYINEERIDDITEEMQRVFLTEHNGSWH